MRHLLILLFAAFLAASTLSATEPTTTDNPDVKVVPSVVADGATGSGAAMHLQRIDLEQRAASDDAAPAQLGPRGGFWWMVGVIVVAGVILAVVL